MNAKAKSLAVVFTVTCVAAGLIVSTDARSAGSPQDDRPAFKPAQSVEQMMEGQNKLFKEIRAGIIDKSWKEATLSAWILAEMANANQFQHKATDYREWAARMSEQCIELAGFLKNKDEKAAMNQVSLIGQTCQSCHDKYKK